MPIKPNLTLLVLVLLAINLTVTSYVYAYHVSDDGDDLLEITSYHLSLDSDDPAPEEEAVPEPLVYQINSGDTLYQIARDFNVSVASLMAENDIVDARLLTVGQQLRIPDSEATLPLPDGQQKVIKQVLSSTLTAYTAGIESTGKTPSSTGYGITYSGSKAEEGRTIAVDPKVIPIGSTVFIDGVGIRTAEDTGSAVRGARIDVFMDDVTQARQFGVKKNVKVYVLS
ncbi:3D domain-containing protein [Paenibacillus doosanensis]|uniref:Cell wall-binding protein YocH n=1 Tax=Paenibacillus konkukensis TaxID=2020716 RepID=A0ABY4RQK5_9BACL|nr:MULTISPECIES: 3D domain-containing protein [Paenibacillus]MCS7459546.1 3D domain-containing protein [Paenibacillus doosanensis]UQZ84796.1 Cell wall-binding protein YocH precursor [Paenibacillus konkukensis]